MPTDTVVCGYHRPRGAPVTDAATFHFLRVRRGIVGDYRVLSWAWLRL